VAFFQFLLRVFVFFFEVLQGCFFTSKILTHYLFALDSELLLDALLVGKDCHCVITQMTTVVLCSLVIRKLVVRNTFIRILQLWQLLLWFVRGRSRHKGAVALRHDGRLNCPLLMVLRQLRNARWCDGLAMVSDIVGHNHELRLAIFLRFLLLTAW
jgi:hypothetical protein